MDYETNDKCYNELIDNDVLYNLFVRSIKKLTFNGLRVRFHVSVFVKRYFCVLLLYIYFVFVFLLFIQHLCDCII